MHSNTSRLSFKASTTPPIGSSIAFNPLVGNDMIKANNVEKSISVRHLCITCMKEYANKSVEELRMEDYQLNRKGPLPGTNLFGSIQQPQSTGQLSSPIGQTNAFGTTGSAGGLYNNLNQPQPTMNFPNMTMPTSGTPTSSFSFGNSMPQTTTSQFGAPTSAFSNGNSMNQPMQQFGAPTSSFSFGNSMGQPTTPQFGAPTSGFSFGNSMGQPTTPQFGPPTSGFSYGNSMGQPTMSQFGAPTSGFSYGNSMGQPTPQFGAPTLGFLFGNSMGQPTQPQFGASASGFTTSFGAAPNSTQSPNFGNGFGSTPMQ